MGLCLNIVLKFGKHGMVCSNCNFGSRHTLCLRVFVNWASCTHVELKGATRTVTIDCDGFQCAGICVCVCVYVLPNIGSTMSAPELNLLESAIQLPIRGLLE